MRQASCLAMNPWRRRTIAPKTNQEEPLTSGGSSDDKLDDFLFHRKFIHSGELDMLCSDCSRPRDESAANRTSNTIPL